MKVSYRTLTGGTSTAYLYDDHADLEVRTGMDKYTEEQIKVAWSDETLEWREVTW